MIGAIIIGLILLPMAWPLIAAVRWRSQCARPILLGGLALFLLAAFTLIAGAFIGVMAGTWRLSGIGYDMMPIGACWLGESAAMMIAGAILRFALPRARD